MTTLAMILHPYDKRFKHRPPYHSAESQTTCADDVTQHASTEQLAARVRGGAATRAISHFPQRS